MHFKNILVTTDLSQASETAFQLAAYDSKMEGSKILLLTVVSDWEVPLSLYPHIPAPERIDEYRQHMRSHAEQKLREFTSHFDGADVEIIVILSTRSVAEEICAVAGERNCDLIVMSSHGRGAVGELFLGGTVQKVLRMAHCPVLVTPKNQA